MHAYRNVFIAAVAVFLVTASARGQSTRPSRPNLIVILADDLGYGDLGCFGQQKLKTPALDAMAAEGMRFTQFYAGAPTGGPSRRVMLTGRHGGRANARGSATRPATTPAAQPTVASVLKAAGYATAYVGQWGIGTPGSLTAPNDAGFEHFFGYVNAPHARNPYPEFLVRDGKVERLRNEAAAEWRQWQDRTLPQAGQGVAAKRVDYAPTLIVDDALRFVRAHDKSPFFLVLSLNGVHANAEAGDRRMEVDDVGAFAATDWPEPEKAFAALVCNTDRDTGRVLAALKELGIERNTLVIFSSSNGPHGEGGHKADFFDSDGKYRGGKGDVLEGGIRVPMIAWWPGTIAPGGENDRQWYAGDLTATAAELAGVKPPDGLDSDSFVAALQGRPSEDKWKRKSPLYWESYEGKGAQAVRFGKWKAIRSPITSGAVELFDMSNDPAEKRDYSQRRPDLQRHATNLLNKNHEPEPAP